MGHLSPPVSRVSGYGANGLTQDDASRQMSRLGRWISGLNLILRGAVWPRSTLTGNVPIDAGGQEGQCVLRSQNHMRLLKEQRMTKGEAMRITRLLGFALLTFS